MKFRRKPSVIEAEQYFAGKPFPPGVGITVADERAYVVTAHKQAVYLVDGDWIVAEPNGDGYYPIKPGIFEASYERLYPNDQPLGEV